MLKRLDLEPMFNVFVTLKIYFLSAVTPLSFLYLLGIHAMRLWSSFDQPDVLSTLFVVDSVFTVHAILEVLFYFVFLVNLKYLETHRPIPMEAVKMSSQQRLNLFLKCMSTVHDGPRYLTGWFYGINIDRIAVGDVKRFLSWAFFLSQPEELNDEELEDLRQMVEVMEKRYRLNFPHGDNHLPCIRINFDPISPKHRPLVYYVVLFLITKLVGVAFYAMGFRKKYSTHHPLYHAFKFANTNPEEEEHHKDSTINYWIRKGQYADPDDEPIMFFHGIGVGLSAYLAFIYHLVSYAESDTRDILVVELPHVSTTFFPFYKKLLEDIPTPRDFADSVCEILKRHGYSKADVVGHSLGSTVLTWCIKYHPEIISRAVFIDPVCFLLHKPDVAYNFIHRKPSTGAEKLIHFFASRELYVSWYLARCFIWYENVLFLADIPKDIEVTAILAEEDCVIPFGKIVEYLKGRVRDLYIMKTLNHGEFLLFNNCMHLLSRIMLRHRPNVDDDDMLLHFRQFDDDKYAGVAEDSGYISSASV